MFKKIILILIVLGFSTSVISAQRFDYKHFDDVEKGKWNRAIATEKETNKEVPYIFTQGKMEDINGNKFDTTFYIDKKSNAVIHLSAVGFTTSKRVNAKVDTFIPFKIKVNAQPRYFSFKIPIELIHQMKKGKKITFAYSEFNVIKLISFKLDRFKSSYGWLTDEN